MIKHKIKRLVFDTLVRIKWSKRSNSTFKNASLVSQLDNLNKFGIVKIDQNFSELADYILTEYMKKNLNDENTKFPIFNTTSDDGTVIHLSLNDEKISDFILSKKISGLMGSYYGRRCYLRNDPLLQKIETKVKLSNGNFHVDRYMQFSLMLLLGDLNEKTTHMEYLLSSHKRKLFDLFVHRFINFF